MGTPVGEDILGRWRRIGADLGLTTDTQIASVLIDRFEATNNGARASGCCIHCHAPLMLYCVRCQEPAHQSNAALWRQDQSSTEGMVYPVSMHGPEGTNQNLPPRLDSVVKNERDRGDVVVVYDDKGHSHVVSSNSTLSLADSDLDLENVYISFGEVQHGNGSAHVQGNQPGSSLLSETRSSLTSTIRKALGHNEGDGGPSTAGAFPRRPGQVFDEEDWGGIGVQQVDGKRSKLTVKKGEQFYGDEIENEEEACTTQTCSSFSVSSPSRHGVRRKKRSTLKFDVGTKAYFCQDCNKSFRWRVALTRHRRTHTSDKRYTCMYCATAFSWKGALTIHMRKHSGLRPFICAQCGYGFKDGSDLKKHTRIHTGDRPYVCQHCGFAFHQGGALKKHILRKHTDNVEKSFICDVCAAAFAESGKLKAHQLRHSDHRPFLCKDCGSSFTHGSHLKRHVQVRHLKQKPFVCGLCSAAFSQRSALKVHTVKHVGGKPFLCERCGSGFSKRVHLKQHTNQRSCVKSYDCQDCQASFFIKKNLLTHRRTSHANRGPLVCPQCPLQFHNRGLLKQHLQTHRGPQKYVCHYCKAIFFHARSLKKHLRLKHVAKNDVDVKPIFSSVSDGKIKESQSATDIGTPVCSEPDTMSVSAAANMLLSVAGESNLMMRQTLVDVMMPNAGESTVLLQHPVTQAMQLSFGGDVFSMPHVQNIVHTATTSHTVLQPVGATHTMMQAAHPAQGDIHAGSSHGVIHSVGSSHGVMQTADATHTMMQSSGPTHCFTQEGGTHLTMMQTASVAQQTSSTASMQGNKKKRAGTVPSYNKTQAANASGKQFVCNQCGAGFTQARYLKRHEQRRHTQEKKFICVECQAGFIGKSPLLAHMRVHTGAQPFQCKQCPDTFTHYIQLKRHLKRFHDSAKEHETAWGTALTLHDATTAECVQALTEVCIPMTHATH